MQRNFSSGEIDPGLYSRADITRYATGLKTLKNAYVLSVGGAENRSGFQFVGQVANSAHNVKLIPFELSDTVSYVLEFGDEYMRVIKNGSYVFETAQNITAISEADPCVITYSGSDNYANGDVVYISGIVGMTELNARYVEVKNVNTGANTFEIKALDDKFDTAADIDSSAFTAYASGGTIKKIYSLATPYQHEDVALLKYAQTTDRISIVHPDYAPKNLFRTDDTDWLMLDLFSTEPFSPDSIALDTKSSGSNTYRYKVTAYELETGTESLSGTAASVSISSITKANPAVVTTGATHGFVTGDEVKFPRFITGMLELSSRRAIINVTSTTTFELIGVDSTNYGTFSTFGSPEIANTYLAVTSAAAPTASNPITIDFDFFTNSTSKFNFNIYREDNGVYGLIGIVPAVSGLVGSYSFVDVGATPDLTDSPKVYADVFRDTDNYPSAIAYYQQRLGLFSTNNIPELARLSDIGNFRGFNDSSTPRADSRVSFQIAGKKYSKIHHAVDLNALILFTSSGEFVAQGGASGAITPTEINLRQNSYNGASEILEPIIIDSTALYVQARGSAIRSIGYDFAVDGYRGDDLTTFSKHLFKGKTLASWDFQQTPDNLLWCVRDDGTLLCLTYVREQNILGWSRHDTAGLFKDVCVVTEGTEDVVYVVVERTRDSTGNVYKCVERMSTRQVIDVKENAFLDSHLTYDGTSVGISGLILFANGTDWGAEKDLTLYSGLGDFVSGMVGNIYTFRKNGEYLRLTVTGYTSANNLVVQADKSVPAIFRGQPLPVAALAATTISGLWHLEGAEVSVFADGFVEASPNNPDYTTLTVTNGSITLSEAYGLVHVGLPYTTDIETLNIDTQGAQSLIDKKKNVSRVSVQLNNSRGGWFGPKEPAGTDLLENLTEMKLRDTEDLTDPIALQTGDVHVNILPEWNSNGRVFIRQVDPVPLTISSIAPVVWVPVREG